MEQTSLNIGSIGQKLESAREAKGVTVSEAGQATKILSKFISAMESDDFGVLSAPVYAKSFIKMYAQYLGLDARPLVDEYTAQHAPKTQSNLPDDVRQTLTTVDQPSMESPDPSSSKRNFGQAFGGVNEAVSQLSGSGPSLKLILSSVGALVLVGIIVLSVTQCTGDESEAPAASGTAFVERQLITDGIPDTYLVKPGVVEVDK